MKKAVALVLAVLPVLALFAGCTSTVRLEERLIIRGMAVDFDQEYIVTVQSYRSKEEGERSSISSPPKGRAFMRR